MHISNPSKGPELSNVMTPEETALGDKCDRQREEEREADAVVPDGFIAVPPVSHRRARAKHRYNTLGYQVLNSYHSELDHVCSMQMLFSKLTCILFCINNVTIKKFWHHCPHIIMKKANKSFILVRQLAGQVKLFHQPMC